MNHSIHRLARLDALRLELEDRLARIDRDLRRDDERLPPSVGERALLTSNDEVLERIQASTVRDLDAVRHAQHRVTEGFGDDCEQCGRPIEARRLESLPQAVLCIACSGLPASAPVKALRTGGRIR